MAAHTTSSMTSPAPEQIPARASQSRSALGFFCARQKRAWVYNSNID